MKRQRGAGEAMAELLPRRITMFKKLLCRVVGHRLEDCRVSSVEPCFGAWGSRPVVTARVKCPRCGEDQSLSFYVPKTPQEYELEARIDSMATTIRQQKREIDALVNKPFADPHDKPENCGIIKASSTGKGVPHAKPEPPSSSSDDSGTYTALFPLLYAPATPGSMVRSDCSAESGSSSSDCGSSE